MLRGEQLTQVGQHIRVIKATLLSPKLFTYRMMLITLHSEEIYIAVVPRLIRDKSRVEASLLECLKDTPYTGELLCRGGICRRENNRNTLVRSI